MADRTARSRKRKWEGGTFFIFSRAAVDKLIGASPMAAKVYLMLASYADDRGRCWPSMTSLARKVGAAPKTVARAISELRALGLVASEPRHRMDGSRASNMYHLQGYPGHETPVSALQDIHGTPPGHPSGDPPNTDVTTPGPQMSPRELDPPEEDPEIEIHRPISAPPKGVATIVIDDAKREIIATWKALEGVSPIHGGRLSRARCKLLRERLSDDPAWMETYRECLTHFPLRCFSGPAGWQPTVDWILKGDHAAKVCEGAYDFVRSTTRAERMGLPATSLTRTERMALPATSVLE